MLFPPLGAASLAAQLKANGQNVKIFDGTFETFDSLMEKFFAQGGLSEEEMRAGIHTTIQKQVFVPVFCVSAEQNIGVSRLMDFIAKYGSSPADRAKAAAKDANGNDVEIALTDSEPVLFVFKTMSEAQFGG